MKLEETKALAILFANTRRKKRTADLVTIAESCNYLKELYGSTTAVADKIGLHPEMIREFLSVLSLPSEGQKLVRKRIIDKLDTVRGISKIKNPSEQLQAIKRLATLQTKESRDVQRLMKQNKLTLQEAEQKIIESRLKELNVIIIDFEKDVYRILKEFAKRKSLQPAELAKEIIANWARRNKAGIK